MIKLSIIIPVYNERSTVEKVVSEVFRLKLKGVRKEVIVVDDCSNDGTKIILKKIRPNYLFTLLENRRNRGKGFSIKRGIKKVTGDIILIQDADLEYQVKDYPKLLSPIIEKKTDFVLGSRHLNTNPWKARKFLHSGIYAKVLNFGGVFYTKLFNILLGSNISDPGTMFKIFRVECLNNINLRSNSFDIDWELVSKFYKKGIMPLEIPISYKSRSPEEGKKIRFMRDGFLILKAIILYSFSD